MIPCCTRAASTVYHGIVLLTGCNVSSTPDLMVHCIAVFLSNLVHASLHVGHLATAVARHALTHQALSSYSRFTNNTYRVHQMDCNFPRSIVEDDLWDAVVHMARNGNARSSRFHNRIAVFGDFMYCEHSKALWRQCVAKAIPCENMVMIHVPSRKHNALFSKIVDFARLYDVENAHDDVTMPWILDENANVVRGGHEGYMDMLAKKAHDA